LFVNQCFLITIHHLSQTDFKRTIKTKILQHKDKSKKLTDRKGLITG